MDTLARSPTYTKKAMGLDPLRSGCKNTVLLCRAYIEPGGSCGGIAIPGEQGRCNPEVSFCHYDETCWNPLADGRGTCLAYGTGECRSTKDCSGGEWCDIAAKRCKPDLDKDSCCDEKAQNCADDLVCVAQFFSQVGQQTVCRVVCTSDDAEECDDGEWCGFADIDSERFCKPFAGQGDSCDFYTLAAFFEQCNPGTHFCKDTDYCVVSDGGGKCEGLGNECASDSECENQIAEWCDTNVNRCKPKYDQDDCCQEAFPTMCEEGTTCGIEPTPEDSLVISVRNQAPTCLPNKPVPPIEVCSTTEPQFCGGIAGIRCNCFCELHKRAPVCVDDPSDNCYPKTGDADCAGICQC